jgi:hypothetical protein
VGRHLRNLGRGIERSAGLGGRVVLGIWVERVIFKTFADF